MDPLTLLREYVRTGRTADIVAEGDVVVFGDQARIPRTARTSYRSQAKDGGFYDLYSLLYFARSLGPSFKFSDYFRKAREAGVTQVKFVDRKDLEDYLTGKTDSSANISLEVLDEELAGPPTEQAGVGRGSATGIGASEQAGSVVEAMLQRVAANELRLRDRNSMLVVPGHSFDKVLVLFNSVLADAQRAKPTAAVVSKPSKPTALPVKSSGRYERETVPDATLRTLGAAELGIQSVAFATAGGGSSASGTAPPPPPPPAAEPGQRTSAPAVAAMTSTSAKRSRPEDSGGAPPVAVKRQHAERVPRPPSSQGRPGQAPGARPIIMVPPGLTSLVNMYNVGPLLETGVFKTVEECRATGDPKKDRLVIQRSMGREKPVAYEITDTEPRHRQDWDRVVAVLCSGKAWQFKKWPFRGAAQGDLLDTFQRVCGFYLHYGDEAIEPAVKTWKVKVFPLSRESRHRDVTVVQDMFKILDAFLAARKSKLQY